MSNSPFKQNPVGDVPGHLNARKGIWVNGPHYESATRNPAWITVNANGASVPVNEETFQETYMSKFKPSPILKEVIIRHAGDFGLILELECTIQCHTKESFQYIERTFLFPGTTVDVSFGYKVPRKSGYGGKTIKGFRVATYGFSTTAEGFWIANFKACAPSLGMKTVNMALRAKDAADRGLKYKVGSKQVDVVGITELMAYDTQINGSVSIDQLADGQVITGGWQGAIVVYHPNHLYKNLVQSATGFLSKHNVFGMGGNQVTESENIPYYTLEYVIERLIMTQAKKSANAMVNNEAFNAVKIKFNNYSYSYPDKEIISGRPTDMLLLGGGKGNYLNSISEGKDFDQVKGSLSVVSAYEGVVNNRCKINLKKILIERSIIIGALGTAKISDPKADTTTPKKLDEGVIDVEAFLDNIFKAIADCTGGMMKLRLIQNPDIHKQVSIDTSKNELIVVDENNGYMGSEIQCYVFNPVDGDGNTRTCSITSNVGSKEYQAGLFEGSMKKSDPMHEVTGKMTNGNTPGRVSERTLALTDIRKVIRNPGSLGSSQFDSVHMDSLVAALGSIRMGAPNGKMMDMLIYPGVGIDIEIDGVYGFLPGNAIMTTQMSQAYFNAKSYFFVKGVDHIFTGDTSDWSTKISGLLSFHSSVSYNYI